MDGTVAAGCGRPPTFSWPKFRNKNFLLENFLNDSFRPEVIMTVSDAAAPGPRPSLDSELTWLLHRAAQHMHNATGEQAEKHGLTLREYIVLSALDKTPGLTQGELGKSLSLDKT